MSREPETMDVLELLRRPAPGARGKTAREMVAELKLPQTKSNRSKVLDRMHDWIAVGEVEAVTTTRVDLFGRNYSAVEFVRVKKPMAKAEIRAKR